MFIRRVASVFEPDVDALPPEFRDVLTPQDVAALRAGPAYFATLARADSPAWLRAVLDQCAESHFQLQFLGHDAAPYRPFFRFAWGGDPAISLPRPTPPRPDLPPWLAHIYAVLGAFRENDFAYAGGLLPADTLKPVSETGAYVTPGGPVDPARAVPFLETLSGSLLCYLSDGQGAWLESCEFNPVDDLQQEVARYFEALLQGTRV